MTEWLADFQFLRPLWLLLLPLLALCLWWWQRRRQLSVSGDWQRLIPLQLLAPLLPEGTIDSHRGTRLWLPGILLLLSAVALAGPSWRAVPEPAQQPADALVVVLDVSLSMLAQDLTPDRLTQAKRSLRDVLALREGADTALIAYAGDAHVVAPLTRDRRTIEALLPALDPYMMPSYGGRADRAVARAIALLEHSGPGRRQILLITDGVREPWREGIHEALSGHPISLQILAVGTDYGAPVPLEDRGLIREEDGRPVIVTTELAPLQALARAHGGRAVRLNNITEDLKQLSLAPDGSGLRTSEERSWQREDGGYWLLWLIVPLALWGWRRCHPALSGYSSVILPLAMAAILTGNSTPALAHGGSLWQTPDQQAKALLPEAPEKAALRFRDRQWQALSHYRAGNYAAAAALWAEDDSPEGHYNRGNALAFKGQLENAIAAYNIALASRENFFEAEENRDRIQALLEQQEQEQEQEKEQQQQQQQEQQDQAQNQAPQQQGQGQPEQESGSTVPEGSQDPQGTASAPVEAMSESTTSPQQPLGGLTPEQEAQTMEQWLRRIPDDPASLLRRKFERDFQQREQQRQRQRRFQERESQEIQELW
ncbi:MAG: VWA domain-containing protein [Halomonadaceae bacterium]|nr:MAG: VWA domain-containing protein [Halomonadaceae bacterium]